MHELTALEIILIGRIRGKEKNVTAVTTGFSSGWELAKR
jgi:hypothetical protein